MPKRAFPFDSYSPLQMKIHVNNFHVEKESHLKKIYGTTSRNLQAVFVSFRVSSSNALNSLTIYFFFAAKTTDLLMKASAKLYGTQLDDNCLNAQESSLKCQSCSVANCSDVCVFCSKKICSACSRNCYNCRGNFCGLCSILK